MRNTILGLGLCLSVGVSLAEEASPAELITPLPKEAYASCAAQDGVLFVGGVT